MKYTKKELNKLALAKLHCEHENAEWIQRTTVRALWCMDCETTLSIENRSGLKIHFTEKELLNQDQSFQAVQDKIDKLAKAMAANWIGRGLMTVNREPKGVGLLDTIEEDE